MLLYPSVLLRDFCSKLNSLQILNNTCLHFISITFGKWIIEINMNNIKRYLGSVSVYISLLTCGLLMTISAIDQYLERKTTFETQESPLTLEDLPVFTICYKRMNFQTDYVHGYCLPQILNQSFKVHGKVNEEFIDASIT